MIMVTKTIALPLVYVCGVKAGRNLCGLELISLGLEGQLDHAIIW